MEKTYRIIAVSGDCSASGMSNVAEIIEVPESKVALVKEYIELDFFYRHTQNEVPSRYYEVKDLISNCDESVEGDEDKFIFTDKWQLRSTWAFMELPDYVDPEDVIEEA